MKLSLAVVVLASTIWFLVLPMEPHGAQQATSEQLGKMVQQIQEQIKMGTENAKSGNFGAPWELLISKVNTAQYPRKVLISERANAKFAYYGAPREMFRPEAANAESHKYSRAQGSTLTLNGINLTLKKKWKLLHKFREMKLRTGNLNP